MSKAKKPMFKAGQVVKTTRFIAHPILGIPTGEWRDVAEVRKTATGPTRYRIVDGRGGSWWVDEDDIEALG